MDALAICQSTRLHSDEGLTLETSALVSFRVSITLINTPVDTPFCLPPRRCSYVVLADIAHTNKHFAQGLEAAREGLPMGEFLSKWTNQGQEITDRHCRDHAGGGRTHSRSRITYKNVTFSKYLNA